jgi:hypothetical protein
MEPGAARRILTFLWGALVFVASLLAAAITLIGSVITLGDDPCALGDEACNGTVSLRVVGVLFTLLGAGAVIGSLGAALSYWFYAIRPDPWTSRRANRLFLGALACAAAVVLLFALASGATDLGVDMTTDRPQ